MMCIKMFVIKSMMNKNGQFLNKFVTVPKIRMNVHHNKSKITNKGAQRISGSKIKIEMYL